MRRLWGGPCRGSSLTPRPPPISPGLCILKQNHSLRISPNSHIPSHRFSSSHAL